MGGHIPHSLTQNWGGQRGLGGEQLGNLYWPWFPPLSNGGRRTAERSAKLDQSAKLDRQCGNALSPPPVAISRCLLRNCCVPGSLLGATKGLQMREKNKKHFSILGSPWWQRKGEGTMEKQVTRILAGTCYQEAGGGLKTFPQLHLTLPD